MLGAGEGVGAGVGAGGFCANAAGTKSTTASARFRKMCLRCFTDLFPKEGTSAEKILRRRAYQVKVPKSPDDSVRKCHDSLLWASSHRRLAEAPQHNHVQSRLGDS